MMEQAHIRAGSAETRYRRPHNTALTPEAREHALRRGIAVVVIEDCRDDWIRQAVMNEARRQIREGAKDE